MAVDRLDPVKLHADAVDLLAKTDDSVALVASLLKTVREQDDRLTTIRAVDHHEVQQAWARAEAAEQERNEYREALRLVKRAVHGVRVGRW